MISFRRRKLRRSPGGGVSRLDAVGGLECRRDKSSICWQPRCWVSSRRMCNARGYGDGEARDGDRDPRRASATGGCARSDAAEIRPGWNRGEGLSIRSGADLTSDGLVVNGAEARTGWRGFGLLMFRCWCWEFHLENNWDLREQYIFAAACLPRAPAEADTRKWKQGRSHGRAPQN